MPEHSMQSLHSSGFDGEDPAAYQFVALKSGAQVAQSCFRTPIGTVATLTRAQACVVCGSTEEDDDGACTSCGTVLPVGEMLSDIDGRAPAFGYQVTKRAAHTIVFS
jgi:hypothetical protein